MINKAVWQLIIILALTSIVPACSFQSDDGYSKRDHNRYERVERHHHRDKDDDDNDDDD